ncbi:MAG: preprotein translocase subunit YajC [Deferribacteraceae bacterium]|jgi:preprotein translocase subunit YajC|nr:preprotein translocase subunit YajC [Deferribacteraceae bacterium]
MFSAIAFAQEAAPQAAAGGLNSIAGMAPILLLVAVFYFLMIRPQQKKQRQLNETINSLKPGDRIITTSGFKATVDSLIDANTFLINLGSGSNMKVEIHRSGIAGKEQVNTGKS